MSRIVYFGPQGTFSEQAARALVAASDELFPADTIRAALGAVRAGDADAGCVPVENSVEGAVPATLDTLAEAEPLVAVAEAVLPIRFSVLVRSGITGTADIRTVASHPHALAQVRGWLQAHLPEARTVAASSTAGAAVAVQHGEYDAAISAPVAINHYPLRVYATDIADAADAATRFLLLRRPGPPPEPSGADRTSIVAEVDNRVGALWELLQELSMRGINLTKLDARPDQRRLGRYRFFIDFEGHVTEPRVGDALASLHRRCNEVRFLGSFPRADHIGATVLPKADNSDFLAAQQWLARIRDGSTA
ncbi:MAG: prephenate dehydratase [Sciscionella sp.]